MAGRKKPCFNFQRGTCRYGKRCKYSHERLPPSWKPKPCRSFARGRCLHGDNCHFSHDASLLELGSSDTDDSGQKEPSGPSIHDQFRMWRYDIKQNTREILGAQPLGRLLPDFIQNALSFVNHVETMQEVITCLSSEGGLNRLGEMLNIKFGNLTDDELQVIFKNQLLPFMQIVAHENVMSSAVVESRYATLLNYLFGIDGKRSVTIFSASIRALTYDENVSVNLEPCLIALSAVLEVNGSAQVNDDLRAAAETMIALTNEREMSGNVLRYHKKMCLRLCLGDHIKTAANTKKDAANRPKPKFDLFIDQPGELSEHGARHDNDFEDIENIQIMPTMEEILSDRAEYLPQTDPSTWHWTGVAGLLDRQFRLLREDTVGQLRDAAKVELARIQNPHDQHQPSKQSGARTYRYHDVRLVDAFFDDHKGLLCVLQSAQPPELNGKSAARRKEWWAESKRLGPDALIMLLGVDQVAIFLTVANIRPPPGLEGGDVKDSPEERFPRAGDAHFAQVVVQLVDRTEIDIETLLFKFGVNTGRLSFSLLEFPGVLLPAFQHTLVALQRMSESLDLPFAKLLAPDQDFQEDQEIEPPAYTKKPGFSYNLSSLSPTNANLALDLVAPIDASALSEQTTLDDAQAEALVSALSRSVALIQGPPGTGKSHTGTALMKVLLANKDAGQLGPILIVTFTNHALDGPLEHAVDAGVKQVIRIGSNSKSEKLADLNLRVVAKNEERTKFEKSENWELRQQIEAFGQSINDSLVELRDATSEASVMSFLRDEHPEYHAQLVQPEVDAEGFRLVRNWRAPRGLNAWLQGGLHIAPAAQGTRDIDLHTLNSAQRQKLYSSWTQQLMEPIRKSLLVNLQAYESVKARLDSIKTEVDLRVLNKANVIGVTTSGLARNIGLLRRLNCKVLIKEEAGEIMEAHSLTAMLPSIEHLILIGDHQQLRPKAQNYDLSCENPRSQTKLDVSMFERLIQPEYEEYSSVPYVALKTQRRMHPSISTLIRNTLYADLEDSPKVAQYPEVSGMRRRLFWLDHNQSEDGEKNRRNKSTSHTNQYEVDMVFALVRHLVRQGVYKATDIAVLTPYLGQLMKLRGSLSSFTEVVINDRDIDELALLGDNEEKATVDSTADGKTVTRSLPKLGVHKSSLLEALRVATIDNFQGEEAKVVIISLVRCNQQRKCGFLRTSNRINVLLSRAQHGMYIVGNSETSSHVPMWGKVLGMLNDGGNVGTQLELCCPRHPETPLVVTTPDDFSSISPEAGCDLLCGQRLPCGHSCVNKCHSEGLHKAVYCLKPCNRVKEGCSHNCPHECGRQCDDNCNVEVTNINVELPCGHSVKQLPCWQYQDPSKFKCGVPVEHKVPGCDHTITMACHRSVDDPQFICNVVCGALQPCGHLCTSKCFKCRPHKDLRIISERHPTCEQQCGRDFTNCRHSCTKPCHGNEACQLCEQVCDVQCSHAKCTKKCSEPCTPCAEEECASCCPHAKCSMPCAAPCEWVPCSKRCTKLLACGHQCPSVCGADCPSTEYCQICGSDTIKSIRADLIMLTTYGEVDLLESPCVFLPCGHIFTVESLDGVMAMADYYDIDAMTGMPTAIKGNSSDPSSEEMKNCPDCRGSLRLLPRYGRVVRRALLDESTKKFISWSNRQYLELAEPMQSHQEDLMTSLASVPRLIGKVNLKAPSSHLSKLYRLARVGNRYRPLFALYQKIDSFIDKTAANEQPFKRVHDIVEALRRRRLDAGEAVDAFDFDQSLLQTRGNLLATALAIRCEVIAVSDFVKVFDTRRRARDPFSLEVDFSHNRDSCETLISLATITHAPLQQTEGHIFWAHFAALECLVIELHDDDSRPELVADIKTKANEHLKHARELCATFPRQTSSVSAEVEDVGRMLRDSGYRSEMKMIVAAMQAEFSGTGHWYRCENGHPFTVGECGRPMEESRCPQCDAPIGGQNHQAADGVRHATDIEQDFGDMRI